MIDWTKPIQWRNPYRNEVRPAKLLAKTSYGDYVVELGGGVFVYTASGAVAHPSDAVWIENVPEPKIERRMIAVLYRWKENIGVINFCDRAAAKRFFTNNPGVILGMKDIVVTEGDGMDQHS